MKPSAAEVANKGARPRKWRRPGLLPAGGPAAGFVTAIG